MVNIYAGVPEKELQKNVIEHAELSKWLVYHVYDSRRDNPGFPDLVLVRQPRVIFAELKTEKGKLRPAQIIWHNALKLCPGIETYIWRPSMIDEIIKILR